MSEKKPRNSTAQPFWRRWHWPGAGTAARRDGVSGVDAARLDVGYEAAYAPTVQPGSELPSGLDRERQST